jgi:uncharacterized protein (TIGR03083 family)
MLLGRRAPDAGPDAPHVKNPMGALNEAWVESFRGRPGAEVLAEFRAVTEMRLEALGAMSDEELDAETVGPVGPQPYREFLQVRLMDCWVHEQDIRRAAGRPGHVDGPAAEAAFARLTSSLPYVIAKRVGAADGTSVTVRLGGPMARTLDVAVEGGRARLVDGRSGPATATIEMPAATYLRLATGRCRPDAVTGDAALQVTGDRSLALAVLEHLNVLP